MLIQILVVALVLMIIPSIFIKGDGKNKIDKKFLMYFAFIGLGYISIQIALIQKFTLFLGQPVYTMLTVISSMLIFSGIGAKYSVKLANSKRNVQYIFLGIAIYTLLVGLVSPILFDAFVSLSLILRIIITVILIAPLSFLMGIPFPTGISAISNDDSRMIGVSWAVNGFFSVIGTVITMILAMMFGFKIMFFIAGVFYLIALLFMTIRNKIKLVNS